MMIIWGVICVVIWGVIRYFYAKYNDVKGNDGVDIVDGIDGVDIVDGIDGVDIVDIMMRNRGGCVRTMSCVIDDSNVDEGSIVPERGVDELVSKGRGLSACVICLSNEIKTVFLGCGHMALCLKCAREYVRSAGDLRCVICKVPIYRIKRVFMV